MILTRAGMTAVLTAGATLRLLTADGAVAAQHTYTVREDGQVMVTEDPKAIGGPAASCDIVNAAGAVLATGTVGLPGSDADVELDHLDIQPGSRVEQTGSLT